MLPISLIAPPVKATITSSISDSIIITWDNYPNTTSYSIYYSNTSDFANPTKISPASSPYTHNITNPKKDYFYMITAIINGEEKRISGDLVSLDKEGKRINIIIPLEPVYDFLKSNGKNTFITPNNNLNAFYQAPAPIPINGPLTITLSTSNPPPGCFGTNLSYYHFISLPDGFVQYYTLAGKDQGSGDPPFYYNYARKLTMNPFSYATLWGAIEPNTNVSVNITDTTVTYINNQPTSGYYGITGSYMQLSNCMQTWMGTTIFPSNPLMLTAKIGKISMTDTGIDTPTITNQRGYFVFPSISSSWPSFSFELKGSDKKLKTIDLRPANATIYAYPVTSASHQQKYTAMGIFTDDSKIDITDSVRWHVWDMLVASVSKGSGIAFPASSPTNYTPGTTSIDATAITSSTDMIISNIVELNLQCFDYKTHYRQNDPTWMDNVYNDYQRTGRRLKSGMLDHSIGAVGCYLTSVTNAMNATGTNVTPQQLNNWMKSPNNGFDGHDAYRNRAFDYPGSNITAITDWQDANTTDIKTQLSQCNIVFAKVKGTTAFRNGHYVLIVKENNGRLMMLDPWKRNTDSDGVFYDYVDNYYTILQYQVLSVKQK